MIRWAIIDSLVMDDVHRVARVRDGLVEGLEQAGLLTSLPQQ